MRTTEFIFEKDDGSISQMKGEIIAGVKKTSDIDILEKIRTALYSTDIVTKITNAVAKESDVSGYLEDIVNRILHAKGTAEDKLRFAEGLSKGYIDINALLSGDRVHFEDLIVAPPGMKGAPLDFALKMFAELSTFTPGEKGPGEMAIAILSPGVGVKGGGDLKIGNKVIEVKSSTTSGGGTMLEGGQLSHDNIPKILKKYFPTLDVTKNLGWAGFKQLLPTIEEDQREALGNELWSYMFQNHPFVDLSDLIDATKKNANIDGPYVEAAFNAYKGPETNKKFDGVLLMNFKIQELQYFKDPKKMVTQIAALDSQLISKQAARLVLPRTTLARRKVANPEKELQQRKGQTADQEISDKIEELAQYLVTTKYAPGSLIPQVYDFMMQLWDEGYAPKDIIAQSIKQFPRLQAAPPPLVQREQEKGKARAQAKTATAPAVPATAKMTPPRKPKVMNPGGKLANKTPGQAV